jgi:hypothetical protein
MIGGLEFERPADLQDLVAGWSYLHTNSILVAYSLAMRRG